MSRTIRVIGAPVDVGTVKGISQEILLNSIKRQGGYICIANAHMLTVARTDPDFRPVLEKARLVTADGMPLVWVARSKGYKGIERTTGFDITMELCALAQARSLSVYFFGGTPDKLKKILLYMKQKFPNLRIAGFYSPPALPARPDVNKTMVEKISGSGADIVFVGLGCPKQEFWMEAHSAYLKSTLVGIGAVFDFISGSKKRAPIFMQKFGLEWLFRFLCEPRRLFRRYLVTNSLFVFYYLYDNLIRNKR